MTSPISLNLFGPQQWSFLPSGLTPYIEGRYNMDISSILSGAKKDLYGEILSSSNSGERKSFDVKFPNQPTRSFSSIEDAFRYCDKNYLPALEARETTIKSQIEDLIKKQGLLEQAKKSGQLSSDKLKLADETLAKIAERLNKLNKEYSGILQKKQAFVDVANITRSTSGIFPSADPNAYGEALNKNPITRNSVSTVFPSKNGTEYGRMLSENPVSPRTTSTVFPSKNGADYERMLSENPVSPRTTSTVFPSKNGAEYGRMLSENPVSPRATSTVFPSKNGAEYERMLSENPIGQSVSQTVSSAKPKSKIKGLKIGKFFKGKGGKLAGAAAAIALSTGGYSIYKNSENTRLVKLLNEKK